MTTHESRVSVSNSTVEYTVPIKVRIKRPQLLAVGIRAFLTATPHNKAERNDVWQVWYNKYFGPWREEQSSILKDFSEELLLQLEQAYIDLIEASSENQKANRLNIFVSKTNIDFIRMRAVRLKKIFSPMFEQQVAEAAAVREREKERIAVENKKREESLKKARQKQREIEKAREAEQKRMIALDSISVLRKMGYTVTEKKKLESKSPKQKAHTVTAGDVKLCK